MQNNHPAPKITVINLKTAAYSNDAKILTLGAVVVDLKSGEFLGERYWRIKHGGDNASRKTEQSVLDNWQIIKQEHPEAYAEVFDTELFRQSLGKVLGEFNHWTSSFYPATENTLLHDAQQGQQITILTHAAHQVGIEPLWQLANTPVLEVSSPKRIAFYGIPHFALDDARLEAISIKCGSYL